MRVYQVPVPTWAPAACNEQVLQYHPDLVFIEFAVNGAYKDGMEE